MARKISVEIPFTALPGTCRVSGRALADDGYAYECHSPQPRAIVRQEVVLSFNRETLASVRKKLKGKRYSEVRISAITFARQRS